MNFLEPVKEALVIGVTAIIVILVFKVAVSGLPDGGIAGSVKTAIQSV